MSILHSQIDVTRLTRMSFQALEWLEDIKTYIAKNPQVAGFPVNDKQVFEM